MLDTVRFDSLSQRQVSGDVYNALREKILSCDLAPGQRLAVDTIAQQLGVSRTPVKEALGRLSAEGLIEILARRGTFVSPVNPETIRDSFQVREALELKACELLYGKIDEERAGTLRELNQRLTTAGVSVAENATLDTRFHQLLVEYTGNRVLIDLYMQLSAHHQIARIRCRSEHWRSRLPLAREEHHGIVDALRDDQTAKARELLKKHIRASMDRVLGAAADTVPLA
jgi:GntR family transcriptional regulator, rspAB operon transcriptional repressor